MEILVCLYLVKNDLPARNAACIQILVRKEAKKNWIRIFLKNNAVKKCSLEKLARERYSWCMKRFFFVNESMQKHFSLFLYTKARNL